MATSKIEWTDLTWNPVRGCTRISPGCINCYAERMAARFSGPGAPFDGFAIMGQSGPRWTGRVKLDERKLLDPLYWRKPRRVFVNSMSDLFHESLSDEAIWRVFAVMAATPHITYQILTKRAERMRYWLTNGCATSWSQGLARSIEQFIGPGPPPRWPLPNVWLGVSCEDQQRADERIPHLIQTPAAMRFVSLEPLIEAVDVRRYLTGAIHLDWVIVGGES